MRNEQMPWNKVRLTLEIVDLGVGQTGKTVAAALKRISDGKWLQSGGGWAVGIDTLTLTAVDAANLPGLYAFAVGSGDLDYDAGLDGYYFVIAETTYAIREYGLITTTTHRNDIRDIDLSAPSGLTAGSLGDLVARSLILRGHNVRVVETAWTNKVPTAGNFYLYDTKAAHDADTGPAYAGAYSVYTFSTTLDGSGNVTDYNCVKTS